MSQKETIPDQNLDPKDWESMRQLGHQMVDDLIDYWKGIREEKTWKPIPDEVKTFLDSPLPEQGKDPHEVYEEFKQYIFPYNKGNVHPRFFAWIQGTGTPLGSFADLLASGMNPNTTIGEHAAMYVDRQVVNWCKELMNFPSEASGILISGGSMANITALTVARNSVGVEKIRQKGLKAASAQLLIYCSVETHSCILKAAEILGLGSEGVRKIQVNDRFQLDTTALRTQIEADLKTGFLPFCIVGTAGTVNTGAIDPMQELLEISKEYGLWFHVDGAHGASAILVPSESHKVKGIERADSLIWDAHKMLRVPALCTAVLFRNQHHQWNCFHQKGSYVFHDSQVVGIDSMPFTIECTKSALGTKLYWSFALEGEQAIRDFIAHSFTQAKELYTLLQNHPDFYCPYPPASNILCFQYKPEVLTNQEQLALRYEIINSSPFYITSCEVKGKRYLRVVLLNPLTQRSDFIALIKAIEQCAEKALG